MQKCQNYLRNQVFALPLLSFTILSKLGRHNSSKGKRIIVISVIIQNFFFSNTISPSFKQIPYWWKVCRLLIKCGSTKSLWIYSSSTLNRSFFQTKQKYSFLVIASLQVVTDWTLRGGMWLHKKSLKWKKVQGKWTRTMYLWSSGNNTGCDWAWLLQWSWLYLNK